ncbi:hypothetical protein B0T24DRAFT_617061 [Lasiosphaeria ovina]|uniref:Uncharacterized protein n=1 Tax=Lasiosphaeria ovina TaxID=92902 RepID=A0AAE0N9J8_9PEZI|nr:hypothetical protein B0T24DRAFT_617061 [Lasiosphaeria ovina]
MLSRILLAAAALLGVAAAYPQNTVPASSTITSITSVTPPPSAITTAPGLTCTDGSTVLYTKECTYGFPISYCHSDPPPLTCQTGYFPSSIQYGHCEVGQTCFPVDADWITTTCSPGGGQTPYLTATLFSGTLAGGVSTVISMVNCKCADDLWYSWPQTPPFTGGPWCMPFTDCAPGMTTSWSTNEYCVTVTTPSYCSTETALSRPYCACATGLPQYPPAGGSPTTCA